MIVFQFHAIIYYKGIKHTTVDFIYYMEVHTMSEEMRKKFAEAVKPVSDKVTGGYQKVEDTVVGGYKKIEDAFVGRYLTRENETVEDAKARINQEADIRRNEKISRKAEHLEAVEQKKAQHRAKKGKE